MRLTIKKYKKINKNFLKDWQGLWRNSSYAHPFNSPSWFLAAVDTYKYEDFLVIGIYNKNKLIAVLPVVKEKRFKIPLFVFPATQFLDKSSFLLQKRDPAVVSTLLSTLKKEGDFYLQEFPEEIKDFILDTSFTIHKSSLNPYLSLEKDAFRFLSKKQKSKVFNKVKKYQITYDSRHANEKLLNLSFQIDSQGSKSKTGKATFVYLQNRNFFISLSKYFKKNFVVDVLSENEEVFVYGIGIESKSTYYALHTSYLNEFHTYSPGKILLYFILKRLEKSDFKEFDFLRDFNTLKKEFTQQVRQQYDVYYISRSTTKLWLSTVEKIKLSILENHVLYGAYCRMKRVFYSS